MESKIKSIRYNGRPLKMTDIESMEISLDISRTWSFKIDPDCDILRHSSYNYQLNFHNGKTIKGNGDALYTFNNNRSSVRIGKLYISFYVETKS